MKKLILSLFVLLFTSTIVSYAQCGDDLLKQALKEMGESQYLKDFTVELVKEKKDTKTGYIKFSIVLNNRNQYKFNMVNGLANPEQIIMQIYQGDKLEASNMHNGKLYNEFEFLCGKTGVYNLLFSFKNGNEGCAKVVQSLVKQL